MNIKKGNTFFFFMLLTRTKGMPHVMLRLSETLLKFENNHLNYKYKSILDSINKHGGCDVCCTRVCLT